LQNEPQRSNGWCELEIELIESNCEQCGDLTHTGETFFVIRIKGYVLGQDMRIKVAPRGYNTPSFYERTGFLCYKK